MKTHLAIAVFVVACGGPSSNMPGDDDPDPTVDARVFMDAPGTVPAMITLAGTATETGFSGTSPVDGVTCALFAKSDETTPIGTSTTGADGRYMFVVTTNGQPFDGYIKATKQGYVDLYVYETAPLTGDSTNQGFNMITPNNMRSLSNIAGGDQEMTQGLVGLMVADASGSPVEGASVSSNPASGAYRYMNGSGFPSSSATATADDSVAFMFNAPPGELTISATKSGATFRSHTIKIRPGVFTSTAITP
jgi:hypothetical protein